MRSARLLVLLLVVTVCGFTNAKGQRDAAPEREASSESTPLIQKWRLSANPFDHYSPVSMLSIHRAIGHTTDLGFGVSMRLDDRTYDDEDLSVEGQSVHSARDSRSEHMDVDAHLALELRRWRPVAGRISWYHGVRLGYGFGYGDSEDRGEIQYGDTDRQSRSDTEFWDHSVSAAAVLGVDLDLVDNLSFAIGLAPVRTSYSWTEKQYDSREDRSERDDPILRWREDTWDLFRLEFVSDVAAFVSLSF
ncbi:MAG: hypothetical protein GF346_06205 [Candidatus Eisenbacteria bacterium]|nr:hypothetical protein [Candidatus Latescibacterota bacterium]MBD3302018.1 hypothetical protein [Candidatus Eisenbacteria bacterium]